MDLYDVNLINRRFVINNGEYKLLLQLNIIPLLHTTNRILLLQLKETEHLKIVAYDEKNQNILPVVDQDIDQIISSIKKISFPDNLQKRILGLSNSKSNNNKPIYFKPLSNEVEILTTSEAGTAFSGDQQIYLKFDAINRITPINFVYGAFDGINIQMYFEVNKESLSLIKNWGILSPIEIYHNNKHCGEFYAQRTFLVNDEIMSFECMPKIVAILNSRKTGWLKIEKINPLDLSDFLVSSVGLYDSVKFPSGYPSTTEWYIIVVPLVGIDIQKDFGVGNVQFCTASNGDIVDILKFEPKFSSYNAFALVNVNSDTLYHAFAQAKKQIEQAVDLLVNILKDDSLYSIHSTGKHLMERDNSIFEQKIIIPTWVYIEIPFKCGKLVCDYSEITKQGNLLVSESFEQIKHELNKIELLLLKTNGTNNKELTPLFNSLKWIRRAWDADDFDDKIIYSIIALEFIVSKEPNTPMMDKSLRKKCKGAIRKIIAEIDNPATNTTLYSQQVSDKFDRTYTESPFMGKLKTLIERLNIPVSDAEMELIVRSRKQRNEIVHGENDSRLPTDEVYRLCECIGRIAFYKLFSLEEEL